MSTETEIRDAKKSKLSSLLNSSSAYTLSDNTAIRENYAKGKKKRLRDDTAQRTFKQLTQRMWRSVSYGTAPSSDCSGLDRIEQNFHIRFLSHTSQVPFLCDFLLFKSFPFYVFFTSLVHSFFASLSLVLHKRQFYTLVTVWVSVIVLVIEQIRTKRSRKKLPLISFINIYIKYSLKSLLSIDFLLFCPSELSFEAD